MFLLFSIPFLINTPTQYLENIFIQTRRSPDGWGYTHIFPIFFNDPIIEVFWFDIALFFIVALIAIAFTSIFLYILNLRRRGAQS